MYHISNKKLHGKVLKPKIPENYFTRNGYEEGRIKRICFSPTISLCLRAMARCIKDETFYVYKIKDGSPYAYIKNEEIVENKYVPDAHLTKEMWIITPIEVELVKMIKVKNAKETKDLEYMYCLKERLTAQLYDWNYIKIEKEKNKWAGKKDERKDLFKMQVRKYVEARYEEDQ